MDVTIMAVTNSLIEQLKIDFAQFGFVTSDDFRWSPSEQVIYYCNENPFDAASLLHELSHALLQHQSFTYDIDLIKMELDAWRHAQETLAPQYGVTISTTIIEDALDTYRGWLHRRSTCPNCNQTGLQLEDSSYRCIACLSGWRANDARQCALRRYQMIKNPR